MGGPDALKVFLDNISPELPLAVLIAHHFDKEMIYGLPKILTRNNDWRCRVIGISQRLQTGTCLIAPIEQQIVCDSEGRVILLDKPWGVNISRTSVSSLKTPATCMAVNLLASYSLAWVMMVLPILPKLPKTKAICGLKALRVVVVLASPKR